MISGQRILQFKRLNYPGVRQFITTNDEGCIKQCLVDREASVKDNLDGILNQIFGHQVIYLIRPLHGAEVKVLPPDIAGQSQEFKCDGLIQTMYLSPLKARNWKPAIIACTTGDCPFIIFSAEYLSSTYDPIGLVGLVHAGWRGCAENIVSQAIKQVLKLGCPITQLRVGLWGGICGKCYVVDVPVWRELLPYHRFFKRLDPKHWKLNLRGIVRQQLLQAGVQPWQISTSLFCSHCQRERNGQPVFYSHRRKELARNGLFIGRI